MVQVALGYNMRPDLLAFLKSADERLHDITNIDEKLSDGAVSNTNVKGSIFSYSSSF